MILHRFMSRAEYEKYKAGDIMVNRRDFPEGCLYGTAAKGFCWFVGNPDKAKKRMKGIVDMEICLTVKIFPKLVEMYHREYAQCHSTQEQGSCIEYCCIEYDNIRFKEVNATDKFYEWSLS